MLMIFKVDNTFRTGVAPLFSVFSKINFRFTSMSALAQKFESLPERRKEGS
jgi:hypothetical protein